MECREVSASAILPPRGMDPPERRGTRIIRSQFASLSTAQILDVQDRRITTGERCLYNSECDQDLVLSCVLEARFIHCQWLAFPLHSYLNNLTNDYCRVSSFDSLFDLTGHPGQGISKNRRSSWSSCIGNIFQFIGIFQRRFSQGPG